MRPTRHRQSPRSDMISAHGIRHAAESIPGLACFPCPPSQLTSPFISRRYILSHPSCKGLLHLSYYLKLAFLLNRCIYCPGCYAATSQPNNSTCSNTVCVAFSCLSGG